jgi:glycosyltransferase involved in cell wall biosynthesis
VTVTILPFGMPEPAAEPRGAARANPLVVTLGYVHEVKGIAPLIDAFGLLGVDNPTARLVIAGEIPTPESERWHAYAKEHAPEANIELPGHVSTEQYTELLRTADLAVQMRLASNGEASAAIADCLANGVPTIVTDLGWASELPDGTAEKVALSVGPVQLKDRMVRLLGDERRRRAMSQAAIDYARECSFAKVADAYLEALRLR